MCNTVSDVEYLNRECIPNVKYVLTEEQLRIANENTSFCDVQHADCISKDTLIEMYKRLIVLVRHNKDRVKLVYKQHLRKNIDLVYPQYKEEYARCENIYAQALKQARYVKKRGIHYGCSDDLELQKLTNLCNEYNKVYWRTSNRAELVRIRQKLHLYIREVEMLRTNACGDISKITLYL